MLEMLQEILMSVITTSPLLAFMSYAIYYLNKENKELKTDNKELNKYVRESEIRNTQILSGVTHTLNKLVDNTDDLKEWFSIKLEIFKK